MKQKLDARASFKLSEWPLSGHEQPFHLLSHNSSNTTCRQFGRSDNYCTRRCHWNPIRNFEKAENTRRTPAMLELKGVSGAAAGLSRSAAEP